MNVCVDSTGSDDLPFAGDHFSSWSNNYVNLRLHIGITGFTDTCNASIFNSNVSLHDSPMIENQRIGNHSIDGTLATRPLRLAHAIANDFPPSELHLVAVDREILLYFDDDVGVREAHLVANGWA